MALTVGVANPGRITSVGNANPGKITSVGNANVAAPKPTTTNPAGIDYNAIARELSSMNSGGGGGGYTPQVYAPKLDLAAINSQARAAAENNVNPYYVKALNDFAAQQAAQKANEQKQYDINIKNMQQHLAQNLEANDIARVRTGEDVATNEAKIADQTDQFQTDSGQDFDVDRMLLAKSQAQSGTTGSGLAAGATATANSKHLTNESRQVKQFAEQKSQQEIFKGRTFDDLTRSSAYAKTAEGDSEKQSKFDLDRFFQAQDFDLVDKKQQLEQERLQRIAGETSQQGKLLINNFINGIADPAKRQAALEAYGGVY